MILTGNEIKKQVKMGNINILPFVDEHVNPNSYNFCLGATYKEKYCGNNGQNTYSDLLTIPSEGLLLQPKIIYLSSTVESICSQQYIVSLIGRSSVGRLGLFVQISTDPCNFGINNNRIIELACVQPIRVYSEMIIGQAIFWKTEGTS